MASRFSIEAIFSAKDYASKVFQRVQSRFSSMSKGMEQVAKINDKVFKGLTDIAKKAAVATAALGGVGVVGAALDVAKTASEFEQAITNVGAVSLMTRGQIKELEDKALDLAKTTKFTATEVANAMELMGKAGFTNKQILEGIDGVLAASAAEGLSLEETASHVSNVLKGMGLDGEDMGKQAVRVADVLALASARTNSSISSLGESMANVSATARQLNVPLEQVVAGVAMLQDVGIDASTAGSALNTMLTQMATPSKSAAAEMKKWGVSFKDAHGNMLPFQEVLAQLSKAAKKAGGNFDQVAFFADLVGLRGQKAAANLKDLFNSGKYQDLARELEGAAGSAKKMADIRLDTLLGDFTLFKSSLDLVKISLFETAGKILRPLIQKWTEWLNVNKDLVATKVAEYIKKFMDALPKIVYWAEKLGKAFLVFASTSFAIKSISSTMEAWDKIVNGNKIVLIVYAVIAAIMALVAFWPEISGFFSRLWQGTRSAFAPIGAFISKTWDVIKSGFWAVVEFIVGAAAIAVHLLRPVWQPVVAFFGWVWGAISGAAISAWDWIVAKAKSALAMLLEVMAPIIERIKAVWEPLKEFFSGLWSSIVDAFHTIVDPILEAAGWIIDKIDKVRKVGRKVLGRGGDEEVPDSGGADVTPGVVGPEQRGATFYSETNSNTSSELTIKDETGRAFFSRPPKRPGIRLAPSGAM